MNKITPEQLTQAMETITARQAEIDLTIRAQQAEIGSLKTEVKSIVMENILLTAFVKEQGLSDEFREFINNYGDGEVMN